MSTNPAWGTIIPPVPPTPVVTMTQTEAQHILDSLNAARPSLLLQTVLLGSVDQDWSLLTVKLST